MGSGPSSRSSRTPPSSRTGTRSGTFSRTSSAPAIPTPSSSGSSSSASRSSIPLARKRASKPSERNKRIAQRNVLRTAHRISETTLNRIYGSSSSAIGGGARTPIPRPAESATRRLTSISTT
jgi:hypothetical protein